MNIPETTQASRILYAGTSGLVLPVPNKLAFPPEYQDKSRLTYYASLFNSLEVNSSFYKIPMASTVSRWATEVPGDFRFTFKLWREITHVRSLLFNENDVARFMQVISGAADRKGCLLVQLAPSLSVQHAGQLSRLLSCIQAVNTGPRWQIAVEFRNRSWYTAEIYDLIADFGATMVVHDMPASATPQGVVSADFVYVRFHGPDGDYKGGYTAGFLHEYAGYINDWQAEGKTVYVYFNNTAGDAVSNLMTLNRILNSSRND